MESWFALSDGLILLKYGLSLIKRSTAEQHYLPLSDVQICSLNGSFSSSVFREPAYAGYMLIFVINFRNPQIS